MRWPNGDQYTGGFEEGNLNGYGTFNYADGRLYDGNWKDGKRHGDGILTLPSGDKFYGKFENNYINGPGECHLYVFFLTLALMVIFIKGIWLRVRKKVSEFINGQVEIVMKETTITALDMDMVNTISNLIS